MSQVVDDVVRELIRVPNGLAIALKDFEVLESTEVASLSDRINGRNHTLKAISKSLVLLELHLVLESSNTVVKHGDVSETDT